MKPIKKKQGKIKILAINDEFAIKIYLLREDVNNSIKSLFEKGSCNWIVKDIQYNRPISFCHITDYVNFSGIKLNAIVVYSTLFFNLSIA